MPTPLVTCQNYSDPHPTITTVAVGTEIKAMMMPIGGKALDDLTSFIDDIVTAVNAGNFSNVFIKKNCSLQLSATSSATFWWHDNDVFS